MFVRVHTIMLPMFSPMWLVLYFHCNATWFASHTCRTDYSSFFHVFMELVDSFDGRRGWNPKVIIRMSSFG